VPGVVIAAATFGFLPGLFIPAGPMISGLPNDEKAKVRQQFATGEVGRDKLMEAEMSSYHGPGTCTVYGTANSNQMLMEFMGLHLPGSSFVNPNTPLREALTEAAAQRAVAITGLGDAYRPVCDVLDAKAFVNGIVGLMATGGSTNLVIHLPAMAAAAGILLEPTDFAEISAITPQMAKVYPNGLADVNHFHAAGGLGYVIGELLQAGLLHPDTKTVVGDGLADYTTEPKLIDGALTWQPGPLESLNTKIVRPASDPFKPTGGLAELRGNLGQGVMKVSAVAAERQIIEAPALVFEDQASVKEAFKNGELNRDVIVVVRFQGPKSNGMPELHSLTPILAVVQDRGYKVALVTDGRMSGASGKVPSAIHVCPEAASGGPLAHIADGDVIRVDAVAGVLEVLTKGALDRPAVTPDLSTNQFGIGREMFQLYRDRVGPAANGARICI
jgi:phosphogluconate dehydratase